MMLQSSKSLEETWNPSITVLVRGWHIPSGGRGICLGGDAEGLHMSSNLPQRRGMVELEELD
jgi:hypothetical protein